MSYVLTHTDGRIFKTLGDGVLDSSTGLTLIGQNFHNYGQLMANNFIRLLENQANSIQPTNPLAGQLWWDTRTKVLKYFDGARFKPCSSSAVGDYPPYSPMIGDQWWNTTTDQLNIFGGTEWVVIGPNYLKGRGPTGVTLMTLTDASSWTHEVGVLRVEGNPIAIMNSGDPFVLSEPLYGINIVGTGLTLVANNYITGTTTNSTHLGNVPADSFVRHDTETTFTSDVAIIGENGLTVGSTGNVTIKSDVHGQQHYTSANTLIFSASTTSLVLNSDTGEILLSSAPISVMGAANKRYVDDSNNTTQQSLINYVNARANSIVAGSAISTLNGLSKAINDDPDFHNNVRVSIASKAPINSPQFSGLPVAPTPPVSDDSSKLATTAFVKRALTNGNVTVVGTLANINVTGDVVGNRFIGDGSTLINIPNTALDNSTVTIGATNISLGSTVSTLSNLQSVTSVSFTGDLLGNVTGTIVTSKQPNITEVGTLSSLSVQNESTLNQLTATGNVTLLGEKTIIGSPIVEVTNKTITLSKGSVSSASSNGAGIIVYGPSVKPSMLYTASTDSWTLNKRVNAPVFYGSGAGLTNVPNSALVNSGNIRIGTTTISPGSITNSLDGLSSVYSINFYGNGSGLTNLQSESLATGNVNIGDTSFLLGNTVYELTGLTNITSDTFTGSLLGTATHATTAGRVIETNQPNIGSLGTLTSLNVNGPTTIKDLTISGNLVVNGESASFADKNLTLAKNAVTAVDANGSGLTVGGSSNATILYNSTTDSWDLNKTVRANHFSGISMQATYADVAEMYESDNNYVPGTVMMFGGSKEVTIAKGHQTKRVAGVVSEAPAYLLNADATGTVIPLALIGKVKCKVLCPVYKGDVLWVSMDYPGVAEPYVEPDLNQIKRIPLDFSFDGETVGELGSAVGQLVGQLSSIINGLNSTMHENTKNTIPGYILGKSLETNLSKGIKDIYIVVGKT